MTSIYTKLSQSFPELPQERLEDAELANQRYQNNTLGEQIKLAAAIKLTSEQEIKKLVQLANRESFIIQPISSGKNWGYGSVAKAQQQDNREVVLLDLAEMKAIKEIDKSLGLISVEPGVTQQQLHEYLIEHNWPYMTPVTGAGPMCSILSNALERGYGITPRTDHFQAVNRIKVVLPHPDMAETSYESAVSSLDLSQEQFIDNTFKWGLGAYVDGIFTQSSMGIVTEATIRLAKLPEAFCSFYVKCYKAEALPQAVNFVRETLQDFEGIVGSINLMDKRRLLSMVADNPNGSGSHQNMTDEQIQKLAKANDISEWMIIGSIYGKKGIVKEAKKLIKQAASFSDQVIFSDSLLIKTGKLVSNMFPIGFLKNAKEQLSSLDEGLDIMKGIPRQVALPLAYWRNPRELPNKTRLLNPDKDDCGLLWYAPLIPMKVEKIEEFVAFIRETTPKYGIEPLITFTNLKHDCIDSTVPIIFDVKNSDAVEKAYACLDELFEQGRKRGFVPYRMNIKQQQEKLEASLPHWQLVKKLKQALDPNNILAPGRYNPD